MRQSSGGSPGSIPACAGEPGSGGRAGHSAEVYPRVCGGTTSLAVLGRCGGGLSPRVRGNQIEWTDETWNPGSIPACAGEPRTANCSSETGSVYPRVCGGTTRPSRVGYAICGLSPRVRGNRSSSFEGRRQRRSIPACAGEPGTVTGTKTTRAVYPRVCGGTTWGVVARRPTDGLSPRVRGNPMAQMCRAVVTRSIPACAGEPA